MVDLSIILVNFNTSDDTSNCLESIYKYTQEVNFEIIVVDNDSTDDSKKIITSKFPDVIWIDVGYNSGFARANNIGIRASLGDFILLLNTDTILIENCFKQCIDLMKKDTSVIASGIQLLNSDMTHQTSGAYFVTGGLNILLPLPYLGDLVRYIGYKVGSKVPSIESVSSDIEVDWVIGAFVMCNKIILTNTILLDEDFFMYSEEIEWCSRLKKKGKIMLYSQPKIIHLGGGSSKSFYQTEDVENGKNLWDQKGLQIILSSLVRIRKQFGLVWFFVLYTFYMIEIPIFVLGSIAETLFFRKNNKSAFGFAKNMIIVSTYFFRIALNRPFYYKT